MRKILLTSAALAFALGISGSALAVNGPPGGANSMGLPDCEAPSPDGTPGGWIAANVDIILEVGSATPGAVVAGGDGDAFTGATDDGVGDDVQAGLDTCDLTSPPS